MQNDPKKLAIDYYFGDLQYWKLPRFAADALENGYDGPVLRRLAGLANLSSHDIRAEDIEANEIDAAFREMGVDAPITKDAARLALALESARRALHGQSNVFDEATHIRIHLCELSETPQSLKRIVDLSEEAKNVPRSARNRLEAELTNAFSDFVMRQESKTPE